MNIYNNEYMYNDFVNTPNVPNTNNEMMVNSNLYGPYEGFVNGNMFRDLYSPYRNYQPKQLIPTNEEEEALLNLGQMGFAMHEMNLLLDVYPNDERAMEEYRNFRNSYNELLTNYQQRFEALNVNSEHLNNTPFGWEAEVWPFDRRDF